MNSNTEPHGHSASWHSGIRRKALRRRAELLDTIRAFFRQRGLLEVETPLITADGITDVHIDSLALADHQGFLRTSPEYFHKRLLAEGMGDLFEIGPVFRAGEHGTVHRTEFTLLEWYRVGWTWEQIAEEAVSLVNESLNLAGRSTLSPVCMSWRQAFSQTLGLDPQTCTDQKLWAWTHEIPPQCDREMRLDWLFASRVQPHFTANHMTIIHDYPAAQAALARLNPQQPDLAERFELFLGPLELANGYRELTDPAEQAARFERDNQRRRALGRRPMPIDQNLLAALRHGLPSCAGIALGVDRLLMAVLECDEIAQVRAF